MDRYLILNGPNLNLLGTRDPANYGTTTLADLDRHCRDWGDELGVEVETAQSNHEGTLIDHLHAVRDTHAGVVLNAGAFTHYSYALHDAIDAIPIPTVEVHISNVAERDPWRRISVIGPACVRAIYGRGVDGYRWGIRHLVHAKEWPGEVVRYGEHPDAIMEIRRPSGPGPHRAVVLVHGGFWQHMWTRDTMDGLAVDLARRGFLTANVEYRRLGTGGGWPQTLDDVTAAIDHLVATEDVGPLAVVGHGAGAQLALLARTAASVPFLPVALSGVLDMESALSDGLDDGAVAAFLGDTKPSVASPTNALRAGPVVVVHGAHDDRVPVAQAHGYAAANPDTELVVLPEVGHFDLLDRSGVSWETVATLLAGRLRT